MDTSFSNGDAEYIFWLNRWSDRPSVWSQVGHFKCIVTRDQINVIPTENGSGGDLNMHMSVINGTARFRCAGSRIRSAWTRFRCARLRSQYAGV